jgi:hypothetical protein
MELDSKTQALIENLGNSLKVTPEVIAKGIDLWLKSSQKKETVTELRNIRNINIQQKEGDVVIPVSFEADRFDAFTGKTELVSVRIPKAQVSAVQNNGQTFSFNVTALMTKSISCTEPDTYAEITVKNTP